MAATTNGGSTTSFSNTPQAQDDRLTTTASGALITEDSSIFFLDVMANDLGGNAKSLWSLDDGISASTSTKNYAPVDLLAQDTARVEAMSTDTSARGARIWITADGKVGYNSAAIQAALQALGGGETLTDSFTYAIRLGSGTLSWATATVVFAGTNDIVTITSGAQAGTVTEDAPATASPSNSLTASGVIAFTDADLSDLHAASFAPAGSNTTALGTFALAAVNEAANAAAGSVQWTYALNNPAAQYLAQGQTVTERFVVTINDGHGSTATQNVVVTITGTNDAPVVETKAGDSAGTASALQETNAGLSTSGTLTVTDADLTDTAALSVFAVNTSGPTGGLTASTLQSFLSVTPGNVAANPGDLHNLTWTFNSGSEAFNFLAQGETLTLSYTVRATDSSGAGNNIGDGVVTIRIAGTNDAPVITTATITGSVIEDQVGTATGHVTAVDPDDGAVLTYTGQGGTAAGSADFHFAIDEFSIVRNGGQFFLDTFSDGVPPPSAPGNPTAYGTTGTLTESGGRAVLDSSNVAPFVGVGTPDPIVGVEALRRTDINPSDLVNGLKVDDNFTVSGTFDLVIPDSPRERYGIMVTDRLIGGPGNPPDQQGDNRIEVVVRERTDGVNVVTLRKIDFLHDVTTNIQNIALAPPAGADQIRFFLTHSASTPGVVVASFEYLDGGLSLGAQTFSSTANIFAGENWIRAGFVAAAPATNNSLVGGTYGTLTVTQSGDWTYTLDNTRQATQGLAQGQTETETFTVMVTDEHGASDSRTITVDVHGSNDAPVMQTAAVSRTLAEDSATPNLTATGLAQFTDVDLTDNHTVSSALFSAGLSTGGPIAPELAALVAHALSAIEIGAAPGDGHSEIRWDFALANSATQFLAQGQTLILVYDVNATDPFGATATQKVTVTITGTNDAPVVEAKAGDSAGTASPLQETNAGLSTSGTLTVTDVDLTDTAALSVYTVSASGPTGGLTLAQLQGFMSVSPASVAANPGDLHNLTWTFNSGSEAFNFLAQGETLTLAYTVRATDSSGAGNNIGDGVVIIRIDGTNDAPVITSAAQSGQVSEGDGVPAGAMTAVGQVTFTDADIWDTHTLTVSTPAAYGAATVDAGGQWHYTVTDAGAVNALAAGEHLADSFTVQVDDHHTGGLAYQAVSIDIVGTNDAPTVAAAITDAPTKNGTLLTHDLLAGAADADHGAVLHIANLTGFPAAGVTLLADGHTIQVDPSNVAFQHLGPTGSTTLALSYNVVDNLGASVGQTASIVVHGSDTAIYNSGALTVAFDATGHHWQILNGGTVVDTLDPGVKNVVLSGQTYRLVDHANDGFQTIQSAVNAALSGDIVKVAPGSYAEAVSIKNYVTLSGSGNGADPAVDTVIAPISGRPLQIDGSGLDATHQLIIENLHVTAPSGSRAIDIRGSTTAASLITIQNIGANTSEGRIISISDPTSNGGNGNPLGIHHDITITGSMLTGFSDLSTGTSLIRMDTTSPAVQAELVGLTITNNILTVTGATTNSSVINAVNASNILIQGNTIDANHGTGINLNNEPISAPSFWAGQGLGLTQSNIQIVNNTISNGQQGVVAANVDHVFISGGQFIGQTTTGTLATQSVAINFANVSNATVTGVTITAPTTPANGMKGINVNEFTGAQSNVTIDGVTLNGFETAQADAHTANSFAPLIGVFTNGSPDGSLSGPGGAGTGTLSGLTITNVTGAKAFDANPSNSSTVIAVQGLTSSTVSGTPLDDLQLTNNHLTGQVYIQNSAYAAIDQNSITGLLTLQDVVQPGSGNSLAGNTLLPSATLNGDIRFFEHATTTLPDGGTNHVSLILQGGGNLDGTGNAGANYIQGNFGDNVFTASGGNDFYVGGGGNDTVTYQALSTGVTVDVANQNFGANASGGGGAAGDFYQGISEFVGTAQADTAIFSGSWKTDYAIIANPDGSYTITDSRPGSPDGTTTFKDFEFFAFADGTTPIAGLIEVAPTVTGPLTSTAAEDAPAYTFDLLTGAADANVLDTLSVFGVTGLSNGVALDGDGHTLQISPSAPAFQSLAVGAHADVAVSYSVTDGHGGNVAQTATITILGTNDDPVALPAAFPVFENGFSSAGVIYNVSDVDNDPLTVTYGVSSFGVHVTPYDSSGITNGGFFYDIVNNPSFESLAEGQTLPDTIPYTVLDGKGGSASSTITYTIYGSNDAPTFTGEPYTFTISENNAVGATIGTVHATDVDNGDTVHYRIAGGNTNNWFSINDLNGVISTNHSFDFEADPNNFNLTVQAADRVTGGLVDTTNVTVSIGDVADSALRVAVYGSTDGVSGASNVAADLGSLGLFSTVTVLNGSETLATLSTFDSILAYQNGVSDQETFGSRLADYVDAGGGLVMATFYAQSLTFGASTDWGRLTTGGYVPVGTYLGNYSLASLGTHDASSPIFNSPFVVDSLTGYYHDRVTPSADSQVVGYWSDGAPLAMVDSSGVVFISLFPDDNFVVSGAPSGDYRELFANALNYTGHASLL